MNAAGGKVRGAADGLASAEAASPVVQGRRRRLAPWLYGELFRPVDIAPLVFFRIFFGAMMLYHVVKMAQDRWISIFYVEPIFHLTYPGFGWVQPWPGNGMYLHFAVMGIAAVGVMAGLFYRVSAAVFAVCFTYVFLLEKGLYQNHYYLICLISALLILVPAHRTGSIDVLWRPGIHASVAPAIWLWLLRVQLAIPYFYGGLAKLNYDWLHGMPMQLWLTRRTGLPYVGEWLSHEYAALLFSYGGLLLDLLIVPALLWRRTRPFAYALAVAFHLMNAVLWDIGIFPWFMIGATLLFFSPGWVRRVLSMRPVRVPAAKKGSDPRLVETSDAHGELGSDPFFGRRQRLIVTVCGVYLAWQLLFPFRHFLYRGDASWTEEGHHFAWHMMLREKDVAIRFFVYNPQTGERGLIKVSDFLNHRQLSRMGKDPDMVLEFVHFVRDHYRAHGQGDLEIRVLALASLNGRKPQLLMDPTLDYANVDRVWGVQPWVVPLTEPLRKESWKTPLDQWEPLLADQIPEDMRSPILSEPRASATGATYEPRASATGATYEPRASATGR
jgi:hypothetical protein